MMFIVPRTEAPYHGRVETSADTAILWAARDESRGSGVAEFGPGYDHSEHFYRKATFWRDGA
ncbi:MAG: hypothetical protein V3W34_10250 [Phycisphaerae bacterium]